MSSGDPHNRKKKADVVLEDEEEDPVDSMLKKTGCLDLHYKVSLYCLHGTLV